MPSSDDNRIGHNSGEPLSRMEFEEKLERINAGLVEQSARISAVEKDMRRRDEATSALLRAHGEEMLQVVKSLIALGQGATLSPQQRRIIEGTTIAIRDSVRSLSDRLKVLRDE